MYYFLSKYIFKIRFLLYVLSYTIAENELKFSIFSNLQGLLNLSRFYKVGFLESDARTEKQKGITQFFINPLAVSYPHCMCMSTKQISP